MLRKLAKEMKELHNGQEFCRSGSAVCKGIGFSVFVACFWFKKIPYKKKKKKKKGHLSLSMDQEKGKVKIATLGDGPINGDGLGNNHRCPIFT